MNIQYAISENLVVSFSGDVSFKMPINPDTNQKFTSYEEAEAWALKTIISIKASKIASTVKVWTNYQFMTALPSHTRKSIVQLELDGDINTIEAMKLFSAAKDIRADDVNLLDALSYCVSKGILSEEEKNSNPFIIMEF